MDTYNIMHTQIITIKILDYIYAGTSKLPILINFEYISLI